MARCDECLHFEVCEALEQGNGLIKVPPIHCGFYKPTADVVPKSEVERLEYDNKLLYDEGQAWHGEVEKQKVEIEALKIANEKMYSAIEATKNEVIEEYRKRVNAKMGKHTHLLGKEYVQRILREVAKETKNEQR